MDSFGRRPAPAHHRSDAPSAIHLAQPDKPRNKMKPIRFLILGVALLAGGAAAYLAVSMARAPQIAVAIEPTPRPDVLVASSDIGEGRKLMPQNVRWQDWPEGAINAAYIRRDAMPDAIETLRGTVVRSRFLAGEPIREAKLARVESGFLSAILRTGMRAVAVRIQESNTAGGFVLPNDRVDVILTTTEQSGSGPARNSSRTILRNVKVLAIDQTLEETKEEGFVLVGRTATLELDPRQAELLTAAEMNGSLSLVLRSFEDTIASGSIDDGSGTYVGAESNTINVVRHAVAAE